MDVAAFGVCLERRNVGETQSDHSLDQVWHITPLPPYDISVVDASTFNRNPTVPPQNEVRFRVHPGRIPLVAYNAVATSLSPASLQITEHRWLIHFRMTSMSDLSECPSSPTH